MKKRIFSLILFSVIMTMSVSSCQRIAGNQLNFHYLQTNLNSNGITDVDTGYGSILRIDYPYKRYEILDGSYGIKENNLIVEGGTAPQYTLFIEEGYENIEDELLSLALNTKKSVIYTAGYFIDGFVYGICNVYKETVGYLSGGGNYAEEEIAYSVYYRYDNEKDELDIIYKTSGKMMIAFSDHKVLYWKDKNIYSYNIDENKEVFLCKDYSYDSGLQHQSSGLILFNENYAILDFRKASGSKDTYYVFLYDFENDYLMEMTKFK